MQKTLEGGRKAEGKRKNLAEGKYDHDYDYDYNYDYKHNRDHEKNPEGFGEIGGRKGGRKAEGRFFTFPVLNGAAGFDMIIQPRFLAVTFGRDFWPRLWPQKHGGGGR